MAKTLLVSGKERFAMRRCLCWAILAVLAAASAGCASKLVRIDSEPGLAGIYVNGEYVGKTPLYQRFRDMWRPWPLDSRDDFTVTARFGTGPLVEEKTFRDVSAWPDIGYVPDEIHFRPAGYSGGQGSE